MLPNWYSLATDAKTNQTVCYLNEIYIEYAPYARGVLYKTKKARTNSTENIITWRFSMWSIGGFIYSERSLLDYFSARASYVDLPFYNVIHNCNVISSFQPIRPLLDTGLLSHWETLERGSFTGLLHWEIHRHHWIASQAVPIFPQWIKRRTRISKTHKGASRGWNPQSSAWEAVGQNR